MLETTADLARRQPQSLASLAVKSAMVFQLASFVLGLTDDLWLAAVVLVGYTVAWSIAWLISRQPRQG